MMNHHNGNAHEAHVETQYEVLPFHEHREISTLYSSSWSRRRSWGSSSFSDGYPKGVPFRLRQVRHQTSGLRCFCCSIPIDNSPLFDGDGGGRGGRDDDSDKARSLLTKIVMRVCHHPASAELLDFCEDDEAWHLIFELCEGGPIFSSSGRHSAGFSEQEIGLMIQDICSVFAHAHGIGVTHGMLGPEFILFSTVDGPNDGVKVWGFGLGGQFVESELAVELLTTAPDAVADICSLKGLDSFSIGAVCFFCLCGYPPFLAEDHVRRGRFSYGPAWQLLTHGARDFVQQMMCLDYTKRMTPAEALRHPWVKKARKQNHDRLPPARVSQHPAWTYQPGRCQNIEALALWVGNNLTDPDLEANEVQQKLLKACEKIAFQSQEDLHVALRASGLLHGPSLSALTYVAPLIAWDRFNPQEFAYEVAFNRAPLTQPEVIELFQRFEVESMKINELEEMCDLLEKKLSHKGARVSATAAVGLSTAVEQLSSSEVPITLPLLVGALEGVGILNSGKHKNQQGAPPLTSSIPVTNASCFTCCTAVKATGNSHSEAEDESCNPLMVQCLPTSSPARSFTEHAALCAFGRPLESLLSERSLSRSSKKSVEDSIDELDDATLCLITDEVINDDSDESAARVPAAVLAELSALWDVPYGASSDWYSEYNDFNAMSNQINDFNVLKDQDLRVHNESPAAPDDLNSPDDLPDPGIADVFEAGIQGERPPADQDGYLKSALKSNSRSTENSVTLEGEDELNSEGDVHRSGDPSNSAADATMSRASRCASRSTDTSDSTKSQTKSQKSVRFQDPSTEDNQESWWKRKLGKKS